MHALGGAVWKSSQHDWGARANYCRPSIRSIMRSDLNHSPWHSLPQEKGSVCLPTHQCSPNATWCRIPLRTTYTLTFAFTAALVGLLHLKSLEMISAELKVFKDLRNNICKNSAREESQGQLNIPSYLKHFESSLTPCVRSSYDFTYILRICLDSSYKMYLILPCVQFFITYFTQSSQLFRDIPFSSWLSPTVPQMVLLFNKCLLSK